MEKVLIGILFSPFNFLYENVTGRDFFLNRHIWTNDRYTRPTSLKKDQLADGGNSKYTVRHGVGWAFIWVLPQGHVKVIARSNQPKRSEYLVFIVFASIVLI